MKLTYKYSRDWTAENKNSRINVIVSPIVIFSFLPAMRAQWAEVTETPLLIVSISYFLISEVTRSYIEGGKNISEVYLILVLENIPATLYQISKIMSSLRSRVQRMT